MLRDQLAMHGFIDRYPSFNYFENGFTSETESKT